MIHAQGQRGFTLVELLIVMFIIGVLTLVIVFNFRTGDFRQELRSASVEFVQTIRLAQGYATAGHTIAYCDPNSSEIHHYEACDSDNYCDNSPSGGECTSGVAPGGYGVFLDSLYQYHLFANTNSASGYDSNEPILSTKDIFDTRVSILQYQYGSTIANAATDPVSIVFLPPTGTIAFYTDGAPLAEAELSLLLKHPGIDEHCRTITINRISNQINEVQSTCSL